ncbi:MAG: GNAT family N-acetyltransferase [Dehalococcoidia bacterium]
MRSPDLYYDLLSHEYDEQASSFDCGSQQWELDLNDFIGNDALRDQELNLSRTYVFFGDGVGQTVCVGFVTLLATAIERREWSLLPKLSKDSIAYRFVPALLIGRLAVHKDMQSQRIGSRILVWVRDLASELRIGCRLLAVQVDRENVGALDFYRREEFVAAPVKGTRNLQTMLYDLLVGPTDA